MIQCDIHYEYTDTFGGEPNYSWVKRGVIPIPPYEDWTDKQAVMAVKKELDMTGVVCIRGDGGGLNVEQIVLRPKNSCTIIFITFHSYGSCGGDELRTFKSVQGIQNYARTFKGWELARVERIKLEKIVIRFGIKPVYIFAPNSHIHEITYGMVADAIKAAT